VRVVRLLGVRRERGAVAPHEAADPDPVLAGDDALVARPRADQSKVTVPVRFANPSFPFGRIQGEELDGGMTEGDPFGGDLSVDGAAFGPAPPGAEPAQDQNCRGEAAPAPHGLLPS